MRMMFRCVDGGGRRSRRRGVDCVVANGDDAIMAVIAECLPAASNASSIRATEEEETPNKRD